MDWLFYPLVVAIMVGYAWQKGKFIKSCYDWIADDSPEAANIWLLGLEMNK